MRTRLIKNILALLFLSIFLASCDKIYHSEGLVIDELTRLPIDSVKISIKELDSTYTDQSGRFGINKLVNYWSGDFEILLEKRGYKTKHINFETFHLMRDSAIIELEKSENSSENICISRETVSRMYYFNMYFISLLNILTLLFLIIKKIRWKILWIIGILLLNLTIFISFTDCSIIKWSIINGPVYLTHFWIYPYSVKIVIPIMTITFWIIFLTNKSVLINDKKVHAKEG
jgi:hypothetical protein